MAKKGHKFFNDGAYNINLVGERTINGLVNTFDDTMHVIYRETEGGDLIIKTYPITTDPGSSFLSKEMGNSAGTAIVVPGQYSGLWKVGLHRGKKALQQIGMLNVYRDNDKDGKLDTTNMKIYSGKGFAINCHPAGKDSSIIQNWSAGCQVFKKQADFKAFLAICDKGKALHGDSFTYTLLTSDDFDGKSTPKAAPTESAPSSTSYKFTAKKGEGTVLSNVNGRKNPNTDEDPIKKVPKGSVVDIAGYVSNGQDFKGITKWYKLTEGIYVWGGAVSFKASAAASPAPVATPKSGDASSKYTFVAKAEEVVVNSTLNVRKNPNTDVKEVKKLKKGDRSKVVGYVTNGQDVKGNAKWYKAEDGNYLWSGAVSIYTPVAPSESVTTEGTIVHSYTGVEKENISLIIKAANDNGVTNLYSIIGLLSVIGKESRFKPQSEKMSYSKERLPEVWSVFSKTGRAVAKGQGKNNYNEKAVAYAGNSEKLANYVYGGKYGNGAEATGDGFKYRGRGFNQITFKGTYKKYADLLGKDLIGNPDLLNDPAIAGEAAVKFLLNRFKEKSINPNSFTNSHDALEKYAGANAGWNKSPASAIKNAEKIEPKFSVK